MNIKICLIIPSLRHGGSERVMSLLANEWAIKKGVKVYLILLTKQKIFYDLHKDVKLIEPTLTYKKNWFSKSLYKLKIIFYVREKCNQIKPDSILSFNERYNNIVLLSLLGTSFRKYVSDRNSPFNYLGFVHNFLRIILYKNAEGIIAQTNTAKKVLSKSTGNKNIRVIPNPLRSVSSTFLEKKNIILNVGRLVEQKNQLELIEIFSMCNYKNWILRIYGSGHLKEEIKNKIIELNLRKHVELKEFTQNIDAVFGQAKIFVLPSLYEGFPNALLEAMAHGLAPISYNCHTGPMDIIEDNINGILVPLSNKEVFIEKLNTLMEDEHQRMLLSVEAKKVKEVYSLNKISNEYYNFILKQ
jgi:glycosyltransferase involved in cell wall biosynthesis